MSSSTKTAHTINFKLCTHISDRLLHQIVSTFLPKISYIIICCNTHFNEFWRRFCSNTIKRILFKLYPGSLHFSKKIIESYNSFGAGAHNVSSKRIIFDPTFTIIFPIFGHYIKANNVTEENICKKVRI